MGFKFSTISLIFLFIYGCGSHVIISPSKCDGEIVLGKYRKKSQSFVTPPHYFDTKYRNWSFLGSLNANALRFNLCPDYFPTHSDEKISIKKLVIKTYYSTFDVLFGLIPTVDPRTVELEGYFYRGDHRKLLNKRYSKNH